MTTTVKTTKRQDRRSKARQLVSSLRESTDKYLGEIVTWDARNGETHTHTKVVQALTDADLDAAVARKLLPRHAFTRASKKLTAERVIDVVSDLADTIMFQFTKKFLAKSEWKFTKELSLELDKTSGKVTCPANLELQTTAQSELDRCMEVRTTSDITRIVQKLMEENADLIPIRAQGGVYFVPQEHVDYLDKVQFFLEKKLGGLLERIPVPANTEGGNRAIQNSVATAFEQLVTDHQAAVDKFAVSTRADTMENAAKAIQQTRIKIEAYAHYLHERQGDLLKAVDQAKETLAAKVDELSGLRDALPKKDNGKIDHDDWGTRLGTIRAKINGCFGSKPKTIEEIAKLAATNTGKVKRYIAKKLLPAKRVQLVDGGYIRTKQKGEAK